MAKGSKKTKKTTLIQWLFFIIVPLILTISIVLIILSITGAEPVNKVKEFANHIPVINQFVTTEEEATIEELERQYQIQVTDLESDVATAEADLLAKQVEIDQLEQEIARINRQIEDLIDELDSNVDQSELISKMINTYQEMAPANAAEIIHNMTDVNVILILQDIDEVQRAAILSALDPKRAADLTEQLLN